MKRLCMPLLLLFIWAAKAQNPRLMIPKGNIGDIEDVAISPNGKFVATLNSNNIILWQTNTGKQLYTVSSTTTYTDVNGQIRFSPDGNLMLIYTNAGPSNPQIRRVTDGSQISTISGSYINFAAFTPDGKYIVTTTMAGAINIYTAATGNLYRKLSDEKGMTMGNLWDDAAKIGKEFAKTHTSKKKEDIERYQKELQEIIEKKYKNMDNDGPGADVSINNLAFSKNGKFIAVASSTKAAQIIEISTGNTVTLKGHTDKVNDAEFSPNGRFVVTASDDGTIGMWNALSGNLLFQQKLDNHVRIAMFNPGTATVQGGTYILTITDGDQSVPVILNATNGKPIKNLDIIYKNISNSTARFSPDGKYIITTDPESGMNIWDANSFESLHSMGEYVKAAGISNDFKFMVTLRSAEVAILWQLPELKPLVELKGYNKPYAAVRFREDGWLEIKDDQDKIKTLNIYTGDINDAEIGTPQPALNTPCYCSPDGKYKWDNSLIAKSEDYLKDSVENTIVNTQTGAIVIKLVLKKGDQVLFSPDSKLAAICRYEKKKIRVIQLPSCKTISIFDGFLMPFGSDFYISAEPGGYSGSAFFSPDSKYLITMTDDKKYVKPHVTSIAQASYFLQHMQDIYKMADTLSGNPFIIVDIATGNVKSVSEHPVMLIKQPIFSGPNENDPSGGRYVITQGYNAPRIWDSNTGKVVGDDKESGNLPYSSILISKDARYLVKNSGESSLDLVDLKTGKQLLKYIFVDGGQCIQITPEGYYHATKNDIKDVYYVTDDLQVIAFDQLDIKYNRPDKVLEYMGSKNAALINSYKAAYQTRMRQLKIDTTRVDMGSKAPELKIINRQEIEQENVNGPTENPFLKLNIHAGSASSTLRRLNVQVNGVPMYGSQGIVLSYHHRVSIDTTIEINLSFGKNVIEAWVTGADGNESYREPLTIQSNKGAPAKVGLYFIGIGINKYKNETENLKWSVNDIRGLVKALKWRCGDDIVIDTIFNNDVTKDIIARLKKNLRSLSESDRVIIAYSGHGLLGSVDKNLFLATYPVNFAHPENDGIPYKDFEDLLDSIKPREKLMLLDACNSGDYYKTYNKNIKSTGVTDLNKKNSFEIMRDQFINLEKGTGSTIITSSGAYEPSGELDSLKHSIFMYSVLESFYNYDSYIHFITYDAHRKYDSNPYTVNALKEYLMKRVPELSLNSQQPIIRSENIDFDWTLWHF